MTIFVQIASYRDPELIPTIQSALAKADRPDKVTFGICYQRDLKSDQDDYYFLKSLMNCRVIAFESLQSLGVCWARSETQKLWDGETYTLQIDSHTRFVNGWDTKLMSALDVCVNPSKSIISTYPPEYIPPDTLKPASFCHIEAKEFTPEGILLLRGSTEDIWPSLPQIGKFLAAGFIFAHSDLIRDVPYDPYLYFYGEEITLAIRAWTSGWDIYHPNEPIIYHHYYRTNSPKHWEDNSNICQKHHAIACDRIQQLVGIKPVTSLANFGLGSIRTLASYEQFVGINFVNKTICDQVTTELIS